MDNLSISDREVITVAIRENRNIITYDRDYGELIFKYGLRPMAGVIYIRDKPITPEDTAKTINSLLAIDNLTFVNTLTVVSSGRIRQRKY